MRVGFFNKTTIEMRREFETNYFETLKPDWTLITTGVYWMKGKTVVLRHESGLLKHVINPHFSTPPSL